jgi:hypothetical protein
MGNMKVLKRVYNCALIEWIGASIRFDVDVQMAGLLKVLFFIL